MELQIYYWPTEPSLMFAGVWRLQSTRLYKMKTLIFAEYAKLLTNTCLIVVLQLRALLNMQKSDIALYPMKISENLKNRL